MTVVEEGSFSKAANRLFISQQALSEVISGIEHNYGLTLFNRTQPISLTFAGKHFAEMATRLLLEKKNMEDALSLISDDKKGSLSVGFPAEYASFILPLTLPKLKQKYPLVEFEWEYGNTHSLEYKLLRGELDLIIGFNGFRSREIETIYSVHERTYIAVPGEIMRGLAGDRLEKQVEEFRNGVDVNYFGNGPYLMLLNNGNRCHFRRTVDRTLETSGIIPDVAYEGPGMVTLLNLAREGLGIAFVPEYLLAAYARDHDFQETYIFPLKNQNSGRILKIAHCGEDVLSKYEVFFVETVEAALQSLRGSDNTV